VGVLDTFLPFLFSTMLFTPPPPPAAVNGLQPPAADLGVCVAAMADSYIPPPNCRFTVSQASVLRGLILRRGGPFNPAPPRLRHATLLGLPEPFAFALLGCGAVALGFLRRGRAPAAAVRRRAPARAA
jgi:hypothetical protein